MAEVLVQAVDFVVPAGDGTVVVSFPDLDDNVVGLLRSAERPKLLTVLVNDVGAARGRAKALDLDVRLRRKRGFLGFWTYLRSRVCLSTHGIFGSRRRGPKKLSIGLWHGELGKTSGLPAGERAEHYDRMYASNSVSLAWRVAEVGIHPDRVLITGMPRHAMLRAPLVEKVAEPCVQHIVWMPTYRVAATGLSRTEGDADQLAGYVSAAVSALEPLLAENQVELWFRQHPAARGAVPASEHVRLASDDELERQGMTLYELLGGSAALITDVSSVWMDYVLVDKPLICAMPDAEHYLAERPMTLEPHSAWFPGPMAPSPEALCAEVRDVLAGVDKAAAQRRFLRSVFHPLHGEGAADLIWADVRELRTNG